MRQLDFLHSEKKIIVKISAKCMLSLFHCCEREYIQTICHGACCRASSKKVLISVSDKEALELASEKVMIKNNLIITDSKDGFCWFQNKKTFLCSLHETNRKPLGCVASPFTLNINNTLIIRHRYFCMKCHVDKTSDRKEAYKIHRESLNALFGISETQNIIEKLELLKKDFYTEMSIEIAETLKLNDSFRRLYKKRRIE